MADDELPFGDDELPFGDDELDEPVLPYAGTSGHQDPETSVDRALTNDADGTTRRWQQRVLNALSVAGATGLTALEAREHFGESNPNRVSPSLTVLHKAGYIARLKEKRGKHLVYVTPRHVEGRELAPYGGGRSPIVDPAAESADSAVGRAYVQGAGEGFARGWKAAMEARLSEGGFVILSDDEPREHFHYPVTRADGTLGACCEPARE